jgi:Carboxypeptidase regulatory-like domain
MKSIHIMLVCVVFCFCVSVLAQTDRGTLTGRISDPSGAAVTRATVIATELASGVQYPANTTDTGDFTIASLPAGSYELTVTASGFSRYLQTGITIDVAKIATLNVVLHIGSTTETVMVTGNAPLLETEDAEQSTTISRATLNDLPLNFGAEGSLRDATAFFKLAPGANDLGPYAGYFKINGLPVASEKIEVDGQDSTGGNVIDQDYGVLRPSVDMVQEFTLEGNTFNAEYSQVGGGLFNFTSRSGTNQIHGSVYENWQNEALNADQPFSTSNYGLSRLHNRQNDYGFNIGGPVVIPHLYNGHDRTFFFFNFEQYRQNNSSVTVNTVPTALMRSGNFSQILTGVQLGTDACGNPIMQNAIYNESLTTVCAGQTVPTAYPGNIINTPLNPAALKIQALIPQTNVPNALTNNLIQSVSFPNLNTVPSFRIDQVLSEKWKMSFYWSYFKVSTLYTDDGLPNPITANRVADSHNVIMRWNNDYAISPTMFLHAGIGWLRTTNNDEGVNANYNPSEVGMPFVDTTGFPQIGFAVSPYGGFSNGSQPGQGYDMGTRSQSHYRPGKLTGVGSLTWVRSSHTYKVGGEYKDDTWDVNVNQFSMGRYDFSGAETALPYLQSTTVGTGTIGFPYASFLLGQVDSGTVSNNIINEWRRPYYALYGQDTWKVNSKFTLNYGLRWEYTSPLSEHENRVSGFSPTTPNPNAGGLPGAMIYEGSGPGRCNCNFLKGYPYAFGPRLGGAYQVTPKTVFRAGWGLVYGAGTTLDYIGSNIREVGVGFNTLSFAGPSFGAPATILGTGFNFTPAQLNAASYDPGIGVTPGSITSPPSPWFDPDGARPSRINNWNIGFQREITPNMVAEAAYVGNRGVWETSGDQGNLALIELNAIPLSHLDALGLNPAVPANLALLTSTFASGAPQAAGFNVPYATFPTGATLAQALRPFPQFGDIYSQFAPNGRSWYDSLQAKITQRFSHGLMLLGAFTWSKSEALGEDYRGRYGAINDSFNIPANKTISYEDQPFIFSIAFTYQIPTPDSFRGNGFSRALLTGWQLGGIERISSGFPLGTPGSLNNLYNVTFDGPYGSSTYANRVPGQPLFLVDPNSHFNPFTQTILNPAAWSDPAPGTYGTTSPVLGGAFRWQRNHDDEANLAKNFKMGERVNLQIRADFFNIFNRLSYSSASYPAEYLGSIGSPSSSAGFGGFGNVYPSVNPSRHGQLVARISF